MAHWKGIPLYRWNDLCTTVIDEIGEKYSRLKYFKIVFGVERSSRNGVMSTIVCSMRFGRNQESN